MLPPHFPRNEGVRDSPTWQWALKRTLSVKNAYIKLNDGGIHCPFATAVWKVNTPLKIKGFLWLVVNRAILTWDNLKKKGWQGPSVCHFCMATEESIDHLFLGCAFSKEIWEQLAFRLILHIPMFPQAVNYFWNDWRVQNFVRRVRIIWDMATAVVF